MIRKALLTDLNSIFEIYASHCIDRNRIDDCSYQYELQKHGFLLGLDSKETIIKLIDKAHLFLVDDCNSNIRGYIILDKDTDYKDDKYKTWLSASSKIRYYSYPDTLSVYEIAVIKNDVSKGIASELLKNAIEIIKQEGFKHLYSIATISPLTNCPSLLFHHRNGFERIAIGIPRTLFNLKNYSSVLFEKNL